MSAPVKQENITTTTDLDRLCVNTIRTLTLDAVQKAESGHPGLPLGAAPMAYVLWTRFLRHNPRNPKRISIHVYSLAPEALWKGLKARHVIDDMGIGG